MGKILLKEMKLSASILSYVFIVFGLMFLLPGYPVLCGAFFTTLGIYQSFQNTRETNDILFSALLPISKEDVVRGKYLFVCLIFSGVQRERVDERERVCTGNGFRPIRAV